ncbi:MAG: HAD family hydrolase [Bacteroides sp.]|nr:HAD family hydrolase [Eubacterium sp.]MCM1419562.1 HAD family hydrolase [Roseburia sp.]MCM1462427.1 HAD family hydrolase [Bacteroides sp.]
MIQLRDFKNEYVGLTDEKVAEHLKLYGYNSETKLDEREKGFSPVRVFFRPRFLLLLAAAALSFAYGEYITGGVLAALAAVYAVTEIVKGKKCDEYFFELKRASRVHYRVVRGGEIRMIRREHLVPDDILLLEEGENVPADAHLLEIYDLAVDESAFTGDKTPVSKITGAVSLNEDLKKSCIYKGTKIVSGRLAARITGTNVDTKYYKTFGAPHESEEYFTALERTVLRVSRILALTSYVLLVFAALFHFTEIDIFTENPILNTIYHTFYPAIAFALCFVPCEAASLIRIYYIHGAKEIAASGAAIKDLRSLEAMSAVSCICIDKSGTVTNNRLEVADTLTANEEMMTNISILACSKEDSDDDIDRAIILNAAFRGADVKELRENELLREYPFDAAEVAMGNLWNVNGARLLCVKGAPEKLLPLCDVPTDMLYTVQNKIVSFEKQGYLVLAAAFARLGDDEEPPEAIPSLRYSFMGLLALENKTRDNIPFAIRSAYKAGIRVVMMTGDSAETALAIARRIGLRDTGVLTGEQLRDAKDAGISPITTGVGLFARITPDQKPEILKLLQHSGEIVAVPGSGDTDSDLLEQADFGIALAGTGTGAAGEAASLTVGDDNFESIVGLFRTARQTYSNAKRCVAVHLTATLTLAAFAFVNLLLGTPFILSPVLIGLIGIAAIPGISFMFLENDLEMKNEQTPSRFIGTGKTRKRFFLRPCIQALGLTAAEVIFYLISSGYGVNSAETVAALSPQSASNFVFMLLFGLLIAGWVNLSEKSVFDALRSKQSFAGIVTGIAVLAALFAVYIPYLNTALGLESISPLMPVIALVITLVSQIPAELTKKK